MKPLPDVYAVQQLGGRWLVVSASEWVAAGRTFERREIHAADVALRAQEKPASAPVQS